MHIKPGFRHQFAFAFKGCFLVLACSLSTLLAARVQPTSGFNLYSAQEEIKTGQEASSQISRQLPLLPESDPVTQYVQRLGSLLASHAPGEKWPYNFHVVNQKEINAFALPGGAIYVNLGTIQACDNEAQLAGVMAHEISHVVQRHGTRSATKAMAAQLPLAILGGMMGRGVLSQAAQLGISFGANSYLLKNSRQAESEADLLGADIMYDSGFNPRAMADFFTKLEKEGGSQGPQFLSDHPNPGNRAEAVSREVGSLAPKQYRSDDGGFLAVKQRAGGLRPMTSAEIAAWQKQNQPGQAVVGVPSGRIDQPSDRVRSFAHNDYRISYPENWQVFGDQNSAVTIAPPQGVADNAVAYGAMISNYEPEDPNASLDQATHELVAALRQSNPDLRTIGNDEEIRVNGSSAKSLELVGTSPIRDQNGAARKEHNWLVSVKLRDGSLLYVVFIAPNQEFGSFRPTFETMLRSLRPQV